MTLLQEKIAIVSGAARGIGYAIAREFLVHGAKVVLCDKEPEIGNVAAHLAQEVCRDHCACGVEADVTRGEQVSRVLEAAFNRFGSPNVLVNNAARVVLGNSTTCEQTEVERTFQVNVVGYWLLSKAVFPYMQSAGSGSIINLGSTHPWQTRSQSFPYNMSKGAVLALTRALAVDFGPYGIRVNSLVPGIVDTEPTRRWLRTAENAETKLAAILASHSLPRLPKTSEVATAAVFLASDLSSAVSATDLIVDCGRQAKRG